MTKLKNVVLPAPLGPIRLTISPSSISKSNLFTAVNPPKSLVRLLHSNNLLKATSPFFDLYDASATPESFLPSVSLCSHASWLNSWASSFLVRLTLGMRPSGRASIMNIKTAP